MRARPGKDRKAVVGRLRIGDHWNAITIIALSQSNPLKAIAEFVENSIDARARNVSITRGREHGHHYLAIRDDGEGVPRDTDGKPDFRYVATHIGDSIKRRLRAEGAAGLQGEFGIGLLSFWTVGEVLTMTSTDNEQRAWQMTMCKGDPAYAVAPKRSLFEDRGTELHIAPLLDGVKALSGEKIQWYLASELRDRMRESGVRVTVVDRVARKQYTVEPRKYAGQLLHQLPPLRARLGDVYAELYLNPAADTNRVGLFRRGTRVLEDLAQLEDFARPPWTTGCLQGHLDAPFVNLTPGTRSGLILDDAYGAFRDACQPLEAELVAIIDAQRRAEEEQASRELLRTIQRAFREALLALPPEEYDWFDIQVRSQRAQPPRSTSRTAAPDQAASPRCPASANRRPGARRSGSSSSSPALCSVCRSRRRRARCRSVHAASSGRCPAIDRAAASRSRSSSSGRCSRAAAHSSVQPTRS